MRFLDLQAGTSLLAGLLLFLGGEGAVYAQSKENPIGDLQEQFEADSTQPSISADLVSVDLRLAATPVPTGETIRAAAVLTMEEGWHINAHQPTYDYLIGTSVDWATPTGVKVENVRYPPPERLEMGFVEDAIDVYEGIASVFFDLRATPEATPGERRLTGRIRVQACNDRTCLRPSTIRASLPLTIAAKGVKARPTGDPIFKKASSKSTTRTVMSLLRQYGLSIAGGVFVLGTAVVLLLVNLPNLPEK